MENFNTVPDKGTFGGSVEVINQNFSLAQQEMEILRSLISPDTKFVTAVATAQTTSVTQVLPETGSADTVYRVGSWDGSQYDPSVYSEYAWNGSAYIKLNTKSQAGEVYDISANHSGAKYADLAAALGTNGANIPQSLRKGGMSVKFVQSSDNKYVQYRLMADTFNTTPSNWQGVDDEPTAGSNNFVKSGGVRLDMIDNSVYYLLKPNSISISPTGHEIYDKDGNLFTPSSWSSSKIDVQEGDIIIVSTRLNSPTDRINNNYIIVPFDANNQPIFEHKYLIPIIDEYFNIVYAVPAGVSKVLCSVRNPEVNTSSYIGVLDVLDKDLVYQSLKASALSIPFTEHEVYDKNGDLFTPSSWSSARFYVQEGDVVIASTKLRNVDAINNNYIIVPFDANDEPLFNLGVLLPTTDIYNLIYIVPSGVTKVLVSLRTPDPSVYAYNYIGKSVWNKTLDFNNNNVAIIGDSISGYQDYVPSGYNTYYPIEDVLSPKQMWWSLLGLNVSVNASYAGSCVTAREGYPSLYDRTGTTVLGNPDTIFVVLGTNDSGLRVELGNYDYDEDIADLDETKFIPAYIKGVKNLKSVLPNARIILVSLKMLGRYKQAIKNIATYFGIDYIDVMEYEGFAASVHPTKKGMVEVAEAINSHNTQEFLPVTIDHLNNGYVYDVNDGLIISQTWMSSRLKVNEGDCIYAVSKLAGTSDINKNYMLIPYRNGNLQLAEGILNDTSDEKKVFYTVPAGVTEVLVSLKNTYDGSVLYVKRTSDKIDNIYKGLVKDDIPYDSNIVYDKDWVLHTTSSWKSYHIPVENGDILQLKTQLSLATDLCNNYAIVAYDNSGNIVQADSVLIDTLDVYELTYVVPNGIKNILVSLKSTYADSYVYKYSKKYMNGAFNYPSVNPLNDQASLHEWFNIIVPPFKKFVDNVLSIANLSRGESDNMCGNAAITFMDSALTEKCAIGYSRNGTIQPAGFIQNLCYIEFGNAFDTDVNTETDFALVVTLKKNTGDDRRFFPLRAYANGELALHSHFGKHIKLDGVTEAYKGVILESPNGTHYMLKVGNDGTLSTELVVET